MADRAVATGWHDGGSAAPGGLYVRTVIRRATGDLDGSIADARSILDLALADGADEWSVGWAWDALAHAAAAQGDVGRATAYAGKSLAAFQRAGDDRGVAWALTGSRTPHAPAATLTARASTQAQRRGSASSCSTCATSHGRWSCSPHRTSTGRPRTRWRPSARSRVLRSEPSVGAGSPEDARLGPLTESLTAVLGETADHHLDRGRRLAVAIDLHPLVRCLATAAEDGS